MNNNPETITEYFNVLKSTMEEFKIKPHNIYNMDEKEFLIGVVKKPMRVLIEADEKAAFLRQPGNRENITVIEAVGIFNQSIPPMVILKGEKHLSGWYRGEMPAHWTTAVSPNGWTDAVLSCAWLQINFEPHTRPSRRLIVHRRLIVPLQNKKDSERPWPLRLGLLILHTIQLQCKAM